MSTFNEIAFMRWHEDGYITIIIDDENGSFVSNSSITKREWRDYKGEAAWDCDYWNITDEEVEWLNTIIWE